MDEPTRPAHPWLPASDPHRSVGRYSVTGVLGRGGMGEVLAARDEALRRDIAIKRALDPSDQAAHAKFVLEAQVTGQLEHPGIVPVHELGTGDDRRPYFTMKRVAGRDLADVLLEARNGPAARRSARLLELLQILLKVCDAVAFAHSRGVIHRDLKPANVRVGEFGEVLVMDWGLAKVLGHADPVSDQLAPDVRTDTTDGPLVTLAGTVLGTPAYMPPEQAAGRVDELDARADVYALGALLYEMLALEPPYTGATAWVVLAAVLEGPPPAPSARAVGRHVPWELEAIATKAMAREVEARYADVGALRADLQAYLEHRLVGAARYSLAATAVKWLRRHRAGAAVAAAMLVTATTFTAVLAQRASDERRAARAEVERLAPALERARLLVAAIPDDPTARTSPSPSEKARLADHLGELQRLAAACAEWRRLDRAHGATAGHIRVLLVLGRLAEASEDGALAQLAYQQALDLDPDERQAHAGLERLPRMRAATLERHRAAIDAELARARAGHVDPRDPLELSAALARLVRFDEPQTTDLLAGRVRTLAAGLREAAARRIAAVATPTADERVAAVEPLTEIDAAAAAWLADEARTTPGSAPRLDRPTRALVERALDRLSARTRGPGGSVTDWRQLLAEAQSEWLRTASEHRDVELALATGALGLLEPGPLAYEALLEYLGSEWSAERAVPAGIALARWSAQVPTLADALQRLVGLSDPRGRRPHWAISSRWWARVGAALPHPASTVPLEPAESADALVRRAVSRATRGDHSGALADLDLALALDPRSVDAFAVRAATRYQLRDLEAAIADATRAIELDPRRGDAHGTRGLAQMLRGELAAADLDFARQVELAPSDSLGWVNRGAVRHRRGDPAAAIADYDRAIGLDGQGPGAYLNRALARVEIGDRAGALADFARTLELDPRQPTALLSRATLLRKTGELDLALTDLDRAIALDPRSMSSHAERALVRAERGDHAGAVADWTRVLELEPDNRLAHANRGNAHWRRGDLEAARADYERALELDPNVALSHAMLANLASTRDDHAAAVRHATRALELDPSLVEGHLYRGIAHFHLRELALASTDLGRALDLAPGRPDAWVARGLCRRELGDFKGALSDLDRALALDPRWMPAWFNRGQLRERMGDPKSALADYETALALDPGNGAALVSRGNARRLLGNLVGANEDFTRAIELDPRHAHVAYDNRAVVRARQGDEAGAREDVDRAIGLFPAYALGWYHRAMLRSTREPEAALTDATRAIELDPALGDAYRVRGLLLRQLGRPRDASADFTRGLALTETAQLYVQRAAAREENGDASGAIEDLGHAIRLDPTCGEAYFQRGALRSAQGDDAGAIADFGEVLRLDPKDALAQRNRANVRGRLGDLAGARTDIDRAIELAPDDASAYNFRSQLRSQAGDLTGALADAERAVALAPGDARNWYELAATRALQAQAGASDRGARADEAFAALGRALDLGLDRQRPQDDPAFAGLRSDPRYERLLGAKR